MPITLEDLNVPTADNGPSGAAKINGNNAALIAELTALSNRLNALEKGSGPAGGYVPPSNDGIFVYASAPKISAGKYTTATRAATIDLGAMSAAASFMGVWNWGTNAWVVAFATLTDRLTFVRIGLVGGVLTDQGRATLNVPSASSSAITAGVALSPTVFRIELWNSSFAQGVNLTWNEATTLTVTNIGSRAGAPISTGYHTSNNNIGYLMGTSSLFALLCSYSASRYVYPASIDRGSSVFTTGIALDTGSNLSTRPSHDNCGNGNVIVAFGSVTPQDTTPRATIYSLFMDDAGCIMRSRIRLGDTVASGISVVSLSPTLACMNWQDAGGTKKFAFVSVNETTGALTHLGTFAGGNADTYLFSNVFRFSPTKFYASRPGSTALGQVLMLAEFTTAPAGLVTNPVNDIAYDFSAGSGATATTVFNVLKCEGYADRMVVAGRNIVSSVNRAILEIFDLT